MDIKRKRKMSIVLMGALFLVTNLGFAADVTVDDILNKMKANQQEINTFKATMTTKTTFKAMPDKPPMTMVQTSKMLFKKPDKMKMEILSPMKQTIIRSGQKIYMKLPDGTIMQQDASQYGMTLPTMEFVPANISDSVVLDVANSNPPQNIYVLIFAPKDNAEGPSKTRMFIDHSKGAPVKVEMYDKEGAIMSTIELGNQLINDFWLPRSIIITSQTIGGPSRTEVSYDSLEVNIAIDDREFKF